MSMDGGRVEPGPHFLRRDGRAFVPVGAHFVPAEGPDWPWRVGAQAFDRAFDQMARAGLNSVRIDVLWEAVEPASGEYDERHLRVLDDVREAARRHGLLLHPALFIGGEVGDAFWDVPWRDGRHPHADPDLRLRQADHAHMLAARWKDDPALLAWDLTDEPPYWLFPDTTEDDARAWAQALVDALKDADPRCLVTIGTSGQDVGHGPFRADVVADLLDFACVHPYPIYAPDLYPDQLLSPRVTHAAAFETALASSAGRAVMVHEYGASSAQFDPERIAAHDRLLTWSSFGRGAVGYFAWCWTDAEPPGYGRAPYVRQPHETQFGVTDWTGTLRPRGRVLAEFAEVVRRLDLDAVAGIGPTAATAATVVPHEFVQPYDPATFGLDEAASGSYSPAEKVWAPERDPAPLVRAWLNAFVLASRAGFSVSFPRESLDANWPKSRLLLLPAPLSSTSSSLLHVRTSSWQGTEAFFERGGTLYVSCSADVAIPNMEGMMGCWLRDRASARDEITLRFVRPWGPLQPGEVLRLPAATEQLATRGVMLGVTDGVVIAEDGDGEPALVVADRGTGHAVTLSFPLELLLARIPDAHGPDDGTWRLYAGLCELAGGQDEAWAEDPEVTTGTLEGAQGGLAALTNHSAGGVSTRVHVPGRASWVRLVEHMGERPLEIEGDTVGVTLEGYGAAVLVWKQE